MFERGCENMDLQQKLNLITRILMQTEGLKTHLYEDFNLNIKGKQSIHF